MRTPLSSALLALCTGAHAAEVWIVDPSGRADFTDPQAAVDTAGNGDTILLRPGQYPGFAIDDKGLAVAAFGAGEVACGPIAIRGLALDQPTYLSGLTIRATTSDAPALDVVSCSGSVRIQGCEVKGSDVHTTAGVRATSCSDVLLAGGDVTGGNGTDYYSLDPGAAGIHASSADVFVYSANVVGGVGGAFPEFPCFRGTRGGHGIELVAGSSAFTSNADVHGGDALQETDFGPGGDGLSASRSSATARGGELVGGAGSAGFDCAGGEPGDPTDGPVQVLTEPTRAFTPRDLVVREGATTVLRVVGEPGDSARLFVSDGTTAVLVGLAEGYRHASPAAPGGGLRLGTIPASGVLSVPWTAPGAPTGGARRVSLQVVLTTPDLQARFLDAYTLAVLDERFYLRPAPGGDPGPGAGSADRPAVR